MLADVPIRPLAEDCSEVKKLAQPGECQILGVACQVKSMKSGESGVVVRLHYSPRVCMERSGGDFRSGNFPPLRSRWSAALYLVRVQHFSTVVERTNRRRITGAGASDKRADESFERRPATQKREKSGQEERGRRGRLSGPRPARSGSEPVAC